MTSPVQSRSEKTDHEFSRQARKQGDHEVAILTSRLRLLLIFCTGGLKGKNLLFPHHAKWPPCDNGQQGSILFSVTLVMKFPGSHLIRLSRTPN